MISGENLFSNLTTISILAGLALIVYLKMNNKTVVEFIKDMREAFSGGSAEVYDSVPNAFQDIR